MAKTNITTYTEISKTIAMAKTKAKATQCSKQLTNKRTLTRNWHKIVGNWQEISIIMTTLLLLLVTTSAIVDAQRSNDPTISQISPKSNSQLVVDGGASHISISRIKLESTLIDAAEEFLTASQSSQPQENVHREENETRPHSRVERSAQPILNENYSKSGPNDVHFPESENEKEHIAAGRYFQYNIKPTGTIDEGLQSAVSAERTKRIRAGKTLNSAAVSSSFLLKGGPRPFTSGSPININPTSSSATLTAATATAAPPLHNGRQNPNPDIQDIITGIVKLLNGNVNVHANTQGIRRPTASRINNRGPPRISEAQTLPQDYDMHKPSLGSSIRPPPYPFDRPERPFITGVPIPEQIVPFRPGFVSNRPPWHRNKPRPPITTSVGGSGRRPIPQYRPLPASQMQPNQEMEAPLPPQFEQQLPPLPPPAKQQVEEVEAPMPAPPDYNDTVDGVRPTDTTYDSEFSNEDLNTQYIEVSDQDGGETAASAGTAGMGGTMGSGTSENGSADDIDEDSEEVTNLPPSPPPTKKEEYKKKPGKHKTGNDKRKPATNDEYTTIIESTSVSPIMSSTYLPMPMEDADNIDINPSTEEVIFLTPSKTPALETSINKHAVRPSQDATIESSLFDAGGSSSIKTTPLWNSETNQDENISSTLSTELKATIVPTPSTTIAPIPSTTTTTANTITTTTTASTTPQPSYQPRPGIVLDDPEFKPGGGRPRPPQRPPQPQSPSQPPRPPTPPYHNVQPTRQHLPPGYGEIFDVTLSAIQGPGSVGGSQQTINIKPYGGYGNSGHPQGQDIIVSASGDDGFVSIDGKRTYINLFGEPTDPPASVSTPATAVPQLPGGGSGSGVGIDVTQNIRHGTESNPSTGYAVPETEIVELQSTKAQSPVAPVQSPTTNAMPTRPHYRQRPTQPPVRIDTCIVGDDSTCDQAQHERCKTDNGVSSCHCRPGYSRRKHREPCRKVISFHLGLRVDRIYEHRIIWDKKFMDPNSEPYGQLSYESIRAIDSAMSMTPYSDEFMEAKVNNIYRGDPNLGGSGVFVNLTIRLDESIETLRPNLRTDVQKHLLGVIHRRNNNIGNSVLYVTTPDGSISALHDLDECESRELNDCHSNAVCTNAWGSFRCACEAGLRDTWADQPQRAGRECQSCPDSYCNNRGTCSYTEEGAQVCACDSTHYGGQCEIDGEVLGVAIGASVAAVIIIVLTLVCLIMWSRRWQREQKNAIGSPVFGYMNTAPLKSAASMAPGYQVTLEDRMRWAQIADVMAQTNHYGAEPIGPTRPSSAMFAYPNLQAMGIGTMGGMSMQSTMQMHQNANLPPVPLPRRLGLGTRSNGMRTLENSSSSEEEDRADLLGRNFQVPRPKSRSNGSIANQSGIYYDVDYEPSGNGIGNTSVDHLYGSQNHSSAHSHAHSHSHSGGGGNSHIPGPQGIPMSTYTSGRAPSSYYMK